MTENLQSDWTGWTMFECARHGYALRPCGCELASEPFKVVSASQPITPEMEGRAYEAALDYLDGTNRTAGMPEPPPWGMIAAAVSAALGGDDK